MATFSNITIDDGLNSTLISFNPPDCDGLGWKTVNGRGFRGNYSTCTDSEEDPSATLNFTGVAVYYRSPYFDGSAIQFRLDGVLSENIDLSTPPGAKFNASATRIVWSQTTLENKVHTLELIPGSQSSTLNVDSFIVTQQINPVPASNATTPGAGKSPLGPLASTQGAISPKTTKVFGLVLGITVGSISFIIFVLLMIVAARTRRKLGARFKWSSQPPPLSNDRQFSQHSRAPQGIVTGQSTPSPPPSPQMGHTDLPMKSMSTLPLGSDVSHDDRAWSPPMSNTSQRPLVSSPMRGDSFTMHSSPTTIKFEPVRRPS